MLSVSTQIAREDDLAVFSQMLKSVSFADELIIFNLDRSDSAALKLFRQFKAKVINCPTPSVVETIRAEQVEEAQGDWVLIMDFDEVIPPVLKIEITNISRLSSNVYSAYAIKRQNYSLGYPLRHGGWGQDYVIRLLRRADFLAWPKDIHSTPQVKGKIRKTKRAMEHHKDASLSQMVIKTNRYSAVEARQFFEGGLPPVTVFTLLRKPIMEFCRRYFFKLGFLDGAIGLLQSLYQSYSVFLSYAKLYELQRGKS
ncbi:hypothetical protein A2368_00365 [Candidatus Collierbacteria bacterium RIFOXYB1_FULL_49_13]|uniref:Glycosyltransferase 2-like domain-containing protein n=1 Tax=Candidatus Collierbacteria bacterium RIFOXYB1_FULL_49_13 TaxID=1817728 RepID=A0A1F5FGZ2_9BACT|nr:MAG: hypothetical protein A2368_00365 [Candidatus Collierbacteria bacterium RIFOXYB1_FULL_49_13]